MRGARSGSTEVRVYKGIPYAGAPVGDLRWQPPRRPKSWEGTRDGTIFGHRCWVNTPNSNLGDPVKGVPENEDCLYLNIWSAAKSKSEHRPVMVWIHGGGFQLGTSGEVRASEEVLTTETTSSPRAWISGSRVGSCWSQAKNASRRWTSMEETCRSCCTAIPHKTRQPRKQLILRGEQTTNLPEWFRPRLHDSVDLRRCPGNTRKPPLPNLSVR